MRETSKPKIRLGLLLLFVASVLSVGVYAVDTPSAFLIALIPLTYTIPAFVFLDRLEPEPRAMRWNAFLWGAGISVLVAGFVNEVTTATIGSSAALVISAPVAEEIMKSLGGLFSPFAHPFFTLWVGLAIGAAVRKGRSRRIAAVRGLLPAMALHASWNASGLSVVFAVLLLGHIVLFFVVARRLRRMRRDEIELVRRRLPQLAFAHNLSPIELEAYGDLRATRRLRRSLPRKQRSAFDERRLMITKLALREQP
ncbi:MAG: PrsW family intramembrane metalloprotease [Actinobacteria bacterium]|nr:PrsW family intramembrane metalloprotease [Actinomycetota bacterium]